MNGNENNNSNQTGAKTMTNNEITTILETEHTERTEAQTKAVRAAMRKIAFSLSDGAFRLASMVGAETRGAVRVPGTEEFQISSTYNGRTKTRTFTNSELRELMARELVTVSHVGGGVGRIEATTIGQYVHLHRY